MPQELETSRLQLRPLVEHDCPFLVRLLNDPGWLRFIGDRGVRSRDDALRYLEEGPWASYSDHGFGLLAVTLRDGGDPVGICGLVQRGDLEHPDLGFAFLEAAGGQGFATEASRAVIAMAREALRLTTLLAIVDHDHRASLRVLDKLGFREEARHLIRDGRRRAKLLSLDLHAEV